MKKEKMTKKENAPKTEEVKNLPPVSDVESRRVFLQKLWKGLSAAAFVEFTAVFFSFLFSGKRTDEDSKPKQLFEAGDINSFKPGTVTAFRGGRFFLARLPDGGFIALSLRCTHLGCSINWEEDKKRFVCPCHASAFNINGEVQNPPAPSALDYFPIKLENGMVKVDIGTKLSRNRFDISQLVYA
jgi:cytochrome b6-f complex iron-sulfur subunit